jgi:hypothetical protein
VSAEPSFVREPIPKAATGKESASRRNSGNQVGGKPKRKASILAGGVGKFVDESVDVAREVARRILGTSRDFAGKEDYRAARASSG